MPACTLCASDQGKPASHDDGGRLGIQTGWLGWVITRKLFAHFDAYNVDLVRQQQRGKPQYVGVQRVVSRAPLHEWGVGVG